MTPKISNRARQPAHEPWPIERLLKQRAIALGMALENTTADTLSFFIIYMSTFIKPQSIRSYLSGIISTLEPFYPDVCKSRASSLVSRTLTGCIKMCGCATSRKLPLTTSDLRKLHTIYGTSHDHDDMLFLAITFTGFHGLLRLGELVMHDNPAYQSMCKAVKRHSVEFHDNPVHFRFNLPMHKADRLYQGSTIVIEQRGADIDPL